MICALRTETLRNVSRPTSSYFGMLWKPAENRPGRVKPSTHRCLLELPTPAPTAKFKKPILVRLERQNRPSSSVAPGRNTWMPTGPQQQFVQIPGPETRRSSSKPRDRQPERSALQGLQPERRRREKRREGTTPSPSAMKEIRGKGRSPILSIRLHLPGYRPRSVYSLVYFAKLIVI
jgi:hypothetical protein